MPLWSLSEAAEIPVLPAGVAVTTLDHGLVIMVREDHSAPVVAAQAWCRAGSIDEGDWLGAGLSHVLEHMLFKGTTTRGAGRIDQEVQAAGGSMNAFTSFDRTVYWINVPNTGATVAIDILCDIAQHATLPADELARETEVIRREMDMCHDDPSRRSSQRLFETAYTRSPYRHPVIGHPDIFNRLQRDDVVAYYQEKYAPNNLFFVVVGDIRATEVVEQIRRAFGASQARSLSAAELMDEPRQVAAREQIDETTLELAHLHWAWHVPDIRHPDTPRLDLLATMLGGGRSSRLYQEVRERQGQVTSISAWIYSPGRAGLFGISAMVEPEKFETAQGAVLAEVKRLRTEEVSRVELSKAVKQFSAAFLSTRKTMQGQATDLGGSWMATGDLNFSERYLAAVRAVTPSELQRVAQEVLRPENRTFYALVPTGTRQAKGVAVAARVDHPVGKFTLPNGLRLLVKEDHRLPFVQFRAVLRGGVLAEEPAQNGATQLLCRMLMQGTLRRSAAQIATEIESVGGQIDTFGGNNSLGASAEVLEPDFDLGLDLLEDVMRHPAFPDQGLEREREIQLASIRSQKDHLLALAFRALRQGLYGPVGYGLDPLGTEETVAGLRAEALAAMHGRLVTPSNVVLAIYGSVETDRVRSAVERQFGTWKAQAAYVPALPASISRPVDRRPATEPAHDKKQAVVAVGFPGTTLDHQDRFALELLQEACSDLGSRLFLRIRDRLGLAYYVGAQNMPGLVPGHFAFYAGTTPEKAEAVEQELFAEVAALAREGLTPEELQRAKAKVIGQKKIGRQDLDALAFATALDELYGLGYEFIDTEDAQFEAVRREDILAVVERYLRPESAVVAWVRPP